MKSVRNSLLVVFSVVLFSGCYTELATVERNDRDYAYDSDTTYEEGSTAINNHYYLDDDYRRSRLRTSFHYYYPENTSWIGGYYNSYFNDPYWGMRQWSWRYDPWYGYYPTYYPTWGCPPYYSWNSYYPYGGYYPVYYPHPIYVNNTPAIPGNKRRADGPSREGTTVADRSRPIPDPSSSGTVVATTPKMRESAPVDKVTPVTRPERTRDESPWWERTNNDGDRSSKDGSKRRDGETVKRNRDGQTMNPSSQNKPNREVKPTERKRDDQRAYIPSSRGTDTKQSGSRPVERQRENRQPSYSPPQNRSPQPAAAPQSGGSNRSNDAGSSSGKKRD